MLFHDALVADKLTFDTFYEIYLGVMLLSKMMKVWRPTKKSSAAHQLAAAHRLRNTELDSFTIERLINLLFTGWMTLHFFRLPDFSFSDASYFFRVRLKHSSRSLTKIDVFYERRNRDVNGGNKFERWKLNQESILPNFIFVVKLECL